MSDFWIYLEIGFRHVLNCMSYDHILFLIALTAAHSFQEWKKLLLLVSVFTIGHTLALFLSVFDLLRIDENLVELLIPLTILSTAVFNFLAIRKSVKRKSIPIATLITLFFGLIHGLGFSNYFKTILPGHSSDKLWPLLEFSLGIEAAQLVVVLSILVFSYLTQTLLKVSAKDFIMVVSAFIIGVVTPMILNNEFWKRLIWN